MAAVQEEVLQLERRVQQTLAVVVAAGLVQAHLFKAAQAAQAS